MYASVLGDGDSSRLAYVHIAASGADGVGVSASSIVGSAADSHLLVGGVNGGCNAGWQSVHLHVVGIGPDIVELADGIPLGHCLR